MQKKEIDVPSSLLSSTDIELFRAGKHYRLYEKLGAHPMKVGKKEGTWFSVWAPNAQEVSVIGDFNEWEANVNSLEARKDASGIWEGFIPGIGHGDLYKYALTSPEGVRLEKGDPFARRWQIPPETASVIWFLDYKWKDKKWLNKRKRKALKPQAFSVYEVHIGSWKKMAIDRSLSYLELAKELVAYVKEMNYTHVEFMPVMEHPYTPSWGYQITGYFAASSRFGTPEELMHLIDALHQADIGVLLDWVPSHFPSDGHGLAGFDGTRLYEHPDPQLGYHPDWKSYIFNYGRPEVRSFLISNAFFWIEKYHADGLRVDAVASMLYLDYSREEGQWKPNKLGGNINLEAVEFLKDFNVNVYKEFPDIVTIAEESTSYFGVSRPTYMGGLGFGQKWMMGWMHDTLNYFKRSPIYRMFHQHDIMFSVDYAFSENFMLPLSHDEVVHGKGSLIAKMPGDEWQRFANLRTMYGYMMTHPGTKLMFMGGEIAQTTEWSFEQGIQWWLLQDAYHKGIQQLSKELNALYRDTPALYEKQFEEEGFEWIDHKDHKNSVVIYLRKGNNPKKPILVICNLTPLYHESYKVGVPLTKSWKEILNTDAQRFGGGDKLNKGTFKPIKKECKGHKQYIEINLAPMAVMVFGTVR